MSKTTNFKDTDEQDDLSSAIALLDILYMHLVLGDNLPKDEIMTGYFKIAKDLISKYDADMEEIHKIEEML